MSPIAALPIPPTQEEESASPESRRWRSWLKGSWAHNLVGLLVLAAIVGGLWAFDSLRDDNGKTGPLDGRTPEVGEPAPQFALRDPGGKVVRLSDFEGKVVWINFWASWCGPCRRELPDIQELAQEFGDEGLVVLALNDMESSETAESFWQELGLDIKILLDSSGAVGDQYRLAGLPSSFFIDREGVLKAAQPGLLTEGQMRDRLAEVGLE